METDPCQALHTQVTECMDNSNSVSMMNNNEAEECWECLDLAVRTATTATANGVSNNNNNQDNASATNNACMRERLFRMELGCAATEPCLVPLCGASCAPLRRTWMECAIRNSQSLPTSCQDGDDAVVVSSCECASATRDWNECTQQNLPTEDSSLFESGNNNTNNMNADECLACIESSISEVLGGAARQNQAEEDACSEDRVAQVCGLPYTDCATKCVVSSPQIMHNNGVEASSCVAASAERWIQACQLPLKCSASGTQAIGNAINSSTKMQCPPSSGTSHHAADDDSSLKDNTSNGPTATSPPTATPSAESTSEVSMMPEVDDASMGTPTPNTSDSNKNANIDDGCVSFMESYEEVCQCDSSVPELDIETCQACLEYEANAECSPNSDSQAVSEEANPIQPSGGSTESGIFDGLFEDTNNNIGSVPSAPPRDADATASTWCQVADPCPACNACAEPAHALYQCLRLSKCRNNNGNDDVAPVVEDGSGSNSPTTLTMPVACRRPFETTVVSSNSTTVAPPGLQPTLAPQPNVDNSNNDSSPVDIDMNREEGASSTSNSSTLAINKDQGLRVALSLVALMTVSFLWFLLACIVCRRKRRSRVYGIHPGLRRGRSATRAVMALDDYEGDGIFFTSPFSSRGIVKHHDNSHVNESEEDDNEGQDQLTNIPSIYFDYDSDTAFARRWQGQGRSLESILNVSDASNQQHQRRPDSSGSDNTDMVLNHRSRELNDGRLAGGTSETTSCTMHPYLNRNEPTCFPPSSSSPLVVDDEERSRGSPPLLSEADYDGDDDRPPSSLISFLVEQQQQHERQYRREREAEVLAVDSFEPPHFTVDQFSGWQSTESSTSQPSLSSYYCAEYSSGPRKLDLLPSSCLEPTLHHRNMIKDDAIVVPSGQEEVSRHRSVGSNAISLDV